MTAEIRTLGRTAAELIDELSTMTAAVHDGLADPTAQRVLENLGAHLRAEGSELRAAVAPPKNDSGVAVVRGLIVDHAVAGPTPRGWRAVDERMLSPLDASLALLAAVAGRPFSWAGQQDGRLINNILPEPGKEQEQTGASSTVLLAPHTEDAFHPDRANLLMLLCVRNPQQVPTTVASVRRARLSESDQRILRNRTVPILPDDSYDWDRSLKPLPVATLWDRADGLAMRYDPAYTPIHEAPVEHQAAYRRLGEALAEVSEAVVLEPGDMAIIDNDVVVHGRAPFTPRYDGTDRWLKRVNVSFAQGRRTEHEALEHGYGQVIKDDFALPAPSGRAVREHVLTGVS
jgi:L-asparagine oxygenase